MKVLNLYAGVGGNRKLWEGVEVTAVEWDEQLARLYNRLYPQDTVVTGDAHHYLLEHLHEFDFVWSSPPCQTHSRMNKATCHKHLMRYPDLRLYEEILLLQNYSKKKWLVENVSPYYEPLIKPAHRVGRHLFWCNFDFTAKDVERPAGFIQLSTVAGKKALQDWLGIHYPENIYYGGNHCPAQVLRNCVHPLIGSQIFASMKGMTV